MSKIKDIWNTHKKMVLAVCLVAVVGCGATLAILTATTGALDNKFIAGETNIDTEIDEEIGANGAKKPYVENTGQARCIVRMRYEISPSNTDATVDINQGNPKFAKRGWIDGGDGFYYYQDVLPIGEKTDTPLFNKVTIPDMAGDNEENSSADWKAFLEKYPDFNITVYQEAAPIEIGNESALVDGKYDQTSAMKVWKTFKNQ